MDSNYTSLLERYFDGLLNSDEIAQVEELKKSDDVFLEEFNLFEKANTVIELDALKSLKENVRKLDKQNEVQKPKLGFRKLRIAASILLIAVVGTIFYAQNQYSNEHLFSESYAPAKDYISDLGSDETSLSKALEHYNMGELNLAKEAFSDIIKENEVGLNEAHFYLGQTFLQLDEFSNAIESLLNVTGDYKPEAQWYIALAHLKLNEIDQAVEMLNTIIKDDADAAFVNKAEELKAQLNSALRKLVL